MKKKDKTSEKRMDIPYYCDLSSLYDDDIFANEEGCFTLDIQPIRVDDRFSTNLSCYQTTSEQNDLQDDAN